MQLTSTPLTFSLVRALLAWVVTTFCHAGEHRAEVYRTFMPHAGPSAYAVVLGPELVLCYDHLRGGVNQAWHGVVDLAPTLRAKINQPAEVKGKAFYQETTVQPLRVQDVRKVPERRLKGYSYEKGGVTFQFNLDGIEVFETLQASNDGRGIERRWRAAAGVTLYFIADPQADARVSIEGATEVSPGTWKFVAAPGAALSMKIEPRE
jgi:hypothetical protein